MKPYYEQDGITIYHGDCLEILPTLSRVDLELTDPPYGVSYESNSGGRRGKEPICNDGTRLSLSLYRQAIPLINAEHVLWFMRWDAWPDVWGILGHHFPVRGLLVWDKGTPGMGDLEHWGPSYELIASVGTGKTTGSRDQSVIKFAGVPAGQRSHATEKPVSLLSYLIKKMNPATIRDSFMGSGSTLVAAKNLGVDCVGIEVDERNCEIAANRLRQGVLFSPTHPQPTEGAVR